MALAGNHPTQILTLTALAFGVQFGVAILFPTLSLPGLPPEATVTAMNVMNGPNRNLLPTLLGILPPRLLPV